MKKNIVNFDDFINPNGNLERFRNKNIDINDNFYNCSYVIYLLIDNVDFENDEIVNDYLILGNDFIEHKSDYYFSTVSIYAINILYNIVCEVI